jgi:hypothetical protein
MRTPATFLALAAALACAAPASAADPIPFDLTTLPQPLLGFSGAAHGASSGEQVGRGIAGGCDLNGDGYDDGLAATSPFVSANARVPGRVYVLLGGPDVAGGDLGALAGAGAAAIDGALDNSDDASTDLTLACAGRVDGDAVDDAVIGVEDYDGPAGENSGAAWVVYGDADLAAGDTVDLADSGSGFRIDAPAAGQRLGHTVDGVGDLDGDGRDDVAVGTYDPTVATPGVAYVVAGRDGGDAVDLATDDALLELVGSGAGSLTAVAGAGDADGDGVPDVVVSDPYVSFGSASVAGVSYVVSGNARGELNVGTAPTGDAVLLFRVGGGDGWLSGFGLAAAGDVDGDGRGDLLVADDFHPNGARAFVVFGSDAADDVDLAALGARGFAVVAPPGTTALGAAGTLAAVGDVDGDGLDDLAFADPDPTAGAENLHAAFLVYGKSDGAAVELASLTEAQGARLAGPEQAGPIAVSGLGDFDANGQRDLLVATPLASAPGGATNAGLATVVRFGAAPPPGPGPGPGPDPGPGPGPGLQPGPQPGPKPKPSQPKFKAPKIAAVGRAQRVGAKRLATVARLTCRSGPCRVAAPRTVGLRIAGERYAIAVRAPKVLRSGARGSIRVKLPKAAARALAGREARLRVRIVVRSNGERTVRTARVTLFAPATAAGAKGA